MLELYHALGGCGSGKLIQPLRKQLFKFSLFSRYWRNVHRQGAAIALKRLNSHRAKMYLANASTSKIGAVKNAYQQSLTWHPQNTHDTTFTG